MVQVLYLMLTSKKGVSALQIHARLRRMPVRIGSYKTAGICATAFALALPILTHQTDALSKLTKLHRRQDKNRHASKREGSQVDRTSDGRWRIARKGNIVARW